MAVGFKWTDSQPISIILNLFCMILMILVILVSFPVLWLCFRKVPGPSESALRVPGPCLKVPGSSEKVFWWSDVASGRSQDPPRLSLRSRDPLRVSCPTGRNSSGLVWTCLDLSQLVWTCRNLSQLVTTCRDSSQLVQTCRNLSELLWP